MGRVWARYGLHVGKQALEQSARSLELTADALGRLATRFEPRVEEPAPREEPTDLSS